MIDDDTKEKEIGSIGSKYIIYKKIGKGGTSKVYKVKPEEKKEEKYYAAKVYKNLPPKKNKINYFEAEKEILFKLNNN